jgi:hypothetical protein
MKKLILILSLILFTGVIFGQALPKGTMVGTHTLTVTLQPGATMEQFMDFLINTFVPEFNKVDPDWQAYLVKGIRGNINTNSIGVIHIFKSDKIRDKYINPDGSYTELGNSRNEKLKPIQDELNKLGSCTTQWTDWEVQ